MLLNAIIIPGVGALVIVLGVVWVMHRREPAWDGSRPAQQAAWQERGAAVGRVILDTLTNLIARVRDWLQAMWARLSERLSGDDTAPLQPIAPVIEMSGRRARVVSPADFGVPADPAEMQAVADTPIPPDWMALVSMVANFEPENDAEHVGFLRAHAAGFLAFADAWRSGYSETCLTAVGLDPAAVQGTFDLADHIAESARGASLAVRQFTTVYAEVLEAVSSGLLLPHNARQWLTGGGS